MQIRELIAALLILQHHRPEATVAVEEGCLIVNYGPGRLDLRVLPKYRAPLDLTEAEATFLTTLGFGLYEINAGWSGK